MASTSLRMMSASTVAAPMRTSTPSRVGTTSWPAARPVASSSTRAITGIPSLAKTFHTPETRIDSVTSGMVKPHDISMA